VVAELISNFYRTIRKEYTSTKWSAINMIFQTVTSSTESICAKRLQSNQPWDKTCFSDQPSCSSGNERSWPRHHQQPKAQDNKREKTWSEVQKSQ
jgi:myosin heavy subunit